MIRMPPDYERDYAEARKRGASVWRAGPREFVTLLTSMPSFNRHGRAIDLGAGEGQNAIYLAQQGMRVTAVDLAREGLVTLEENARKAGVDDRVRTFPLDMRKFPLQKSRYHVLMSSFALHHIPREHAYGVIARAKASVKPGGLVAISAFTREGTMYELTDKPRPSPHGYLETGELRRLFEKDGWTIHHYSERRVPVRTRGPKGERLDNGAAYLIARKPLA